MRLFISVDVEIASCLKEAVSDGVNGRGSEKMARFAFGECFDSISQFLGPELCKTRMAVF
jgi:hypothetical protein